MELQSDETSGGGQSAAGTESDEHIVDHSNIFRPTFSPAAREADDDKMPDHVDTQTRTVVEPAGNYTDDDDVDEPVEAPAGGVADEPAENYTNTEAGEAVPVDEAPAADAAWAAAPAELVTAAPAAASAPPAPVAFADLDQPLLSGDTELLARWQLVLLEFIDDPQAAVAGAADLVEQAGRELVEALQQRQRQMRTMWDLSSAGGSVEQGAIKTDTEQLRQMMLRYRTLFNQLHQLA